NLERTITNSGTSGILPGMRKSFSPLRGTVHTLELDSTVLQGNTPGDPTKRQVLVYTPPDYSPNAGYPLLVDLVGYTGSGHSHTNWKPFGYSLPERLDHLITSGAMPPVVAAMPDCFTAYGGNQYINSSATGRYMDYLCDEVVPLAERTFSCGGSPARRGVFGKSSGGYGALIHGMQRPDVWGAIASHSGDAYFEYAYLADFPGLLNQLRAHDESLTKFLDAIWAKEKLSHDEGMALMMVGMAAHYDPDPAAPHGFHLPFDCHTGAIHWDRWEKWLPHDPVRMAAVAGGALRTLKGIYIDCGSKDQFQLLWGARQVHRVLEQQQIEHAYHEFDDDHSDVDYRMEVSLPFLARALS
ncbi:MAG: alpha/beta hydrolase-fold protein, partial [bacterium]